MMDNALLTLLQLKAIEVISQDEPNNYRLTDFGKKLVAFPVDVKLAAVIVAAAERYGCLEEALVIVSMLSVENVFMTSGRNPEKSLKADQEFASPEGDLIKLLNIFRKYRESNENFVWCREK